MESCVYLNGEFINLYTKDNPILETNQECYGLIFNNESYHRPLIIRGVIVEDKFVDGVNKQYMIKILEVVESPKIIQEFFVNQRFYLHPYYNENISQRKLVHINSNWNANNYLVKLDAFYVRDSLNKITELRNEYISVVRKDLEKMLSDINSI